ncbi:5'-hydroxyaverantin dehydrogenase [Metarhizium brunneum]|uniref:Hydroxynaphthalene reductase-like protein Arp2 n=1 Tax=Metarhizium brunneum TaxID=500148 RepID=A0A7D5V2Y9_9HYPO
MTEITLNSLNLSSVRDKVVVLAGGAQGIGAATVSTLYRAGGHVVCGDWNEDAARSYNNALIANAGDGTGSIQFVKVDISKYESQLDLFDAAIKTHGRVDIAICCAAVGEQAGWFEPESLDLESVRTVPTPLADILDINLKGSLYFTRIALAYLRPQGPAEGRGGSRSIILLSSVAGFKESPGLFAYSASKHGVLGIMRGLRLYTPARFNVRINVVCPWATDTQMLGHVKRAWEAAGLPMNQPADVARIICELATGEQHNGRAVFVGGGRGYDIEKGIDDLEPQWLGEEPARALNRGQQVLGMGENWGKGKL